MTIIEYNKLKIGDPVVLVSTGEPGEVTELDRHFSELTARHYSNGKHKYIKTKSFYTQFASLKDDETSEIKTN